MYKARRTRAFRRIRQAGYIPTGRKIADRVYELTGTGPLEGKTGIVMFTDYEDVKDTKALNAFFTQAVNRYYDADHMYVCFAVDYYFGAVAVDVRQRFMMADDFPGNLLKAVAA